MQFHIGRLPFGLTHDVVTHDDDPYLERWILWFGWSLRLHRFLDSDRDRAPHDHPWWFVTLPFHAYGEHYMDGETACFRRVKPWRLHFRSSRFRHRVEIQRRPSWTLVLTGLKSKEWGFWEEGEAGKEFVHNEEWLNSQ